MHHRFFSYLAISKYLSLSFSLIFILISFGTAKSRISELYIYIYISLCLVFKPRLLILSIYSFESFSEQRKLMVSRWILRDSKRPQVYRTLLNILADLNNSVVSMVFTPSLISKNSNSSFNPLVTLPRAPTTVDITVTYMLHSVFNSQARSRYLALFLLSFSFTLLSAWMTKSTIRRVPLLFFLMTIRICLREVCASHFPGRILVCAYSIRLHCQI